MAGSAKTRGDSGSVALLDAPAPPHSIEAEQAVLGGLLLDAQAWDNVADAVTRQDFYRPDHQLIFDAIGALAGDAKPCDVVTVSQHLERTGKLEGAGGLAYLSSIARDTPTAANVRAYADIVRERSLLRQLIRAGTEIAASVFKNDGQTARDLVDRAEQKVFEIAEGSFRGREGAVAVRASAAGRHRPDRRVAQQSRQAARPADGLHRLRQAHRRTAPRGPGDRRRPPLDGQDRRSRSTWPSTPQCIPARAPRSPSSAWKCRPSR